MVIVEWDAHPFFGSTDSLFGDWSHSNILMQIDVASVYLRTSWELNYLVVGNCEELRVSMFCSFHGSAISQSYMDYSAFLASPT